jgi:hypothetical protein
MPPAEILTKYYLLSDHPFEPERDTKRHFDFKAQNLSLMKELRMFEHSQLKDYFVNVGSFNASCAEVENFLHNVGYNGSPAPPAILIQGARGSGMDSMAQYVALAVRARAAGATSYLIPIPSASQSRLLVLVKAELKGFMPNEEKIFTKYDGLIDPQKPDLAYLRAMFLELAARNIPNQPLILLLKSVSWDCRDWLLSLYQLLSPLNVFLVFFTEDTRVASWFDDLVAKSLLLGRSVRLRGLDAGEGRSFVEMRLSSFRSVSVVPESFPFNPQALPLIFRDVPEQRVGVKFFIQILRNSLNAKIAALEGSYVDPPPPRSAIQIEWMDISDAYEAILRKKAPTP